MAARSYRSQGKWTKKTKAWDSVSSDLFDAVVSARSKVSPGGWMEKSKIAYDYSHSPGSKASVDSSPRNDSPTSQESVSKSTGTTTTGARRKILQKKKKLTESLKVFDFASDEEEEGRELLEEEEEEDGGRGQRAEAKSTNGRQIKKARGIAQARGAQRKAGKATVESQGSDAIPDSGTRGKESSRAKSEHVKAADTASKKTGPLKNSSDAKSVSKAAKKTYSRNPSRTTSQTKGNRAAVSKQSRTTKRNSSAAAAESDPGDIIELPSKRAKVSPEADSEDVWGSQNLEAIEEEEEEGGRETPASSEMEIEEELQEEMEEEAEKMPYVNMYPGRSRVTRGFVRMLSSQESDLESPSLTASDLESQTLLKSQEVAAKGFPEKGTRDLNTRAKPRVRSGAKGKSPAAGGGWSDSETEGSQESQETVEKQAAKVVVHPNRGSQSRKNSSRSVAATPTDSVTPLPTSSVDTEWLRSSPEDDSQGEVAEVSEDPLEGVRCSGTDSSRSQGSSGRGQTRGSKSTAESGLGSKSPDDDGMETGSTDLDTTGDKQLVLEGSSIEYRVTSQSGSGSRKPTTSASERNYRKPSSKSDSKKLAPVIEITDEVESKTQPIDSFLEETPNLSLSEPADRPAFSRHFERHLYAAVPSVKKSVSGASTPSKAPPPPPPSLTRSSTWPKSYSASGAPGLGQGHVVKCARGEKELVMVVRNVKQAHECLELGENQQFFDEMEYLLESLRPHQSTSLRGLGMCNLAQQCLSTSFSQQIRAHGFTPKITALLGDCLEDPTLRIAAAVLMYVITRDRLNSDWSKEGLELLVSMLAVEGERSGAEYGSLEAELSSKARREFAKVKAKASSVLQKVREALLSRDNRPSGEGPGDGGEGEEEGGGTRENGEKEFCVDPENISVSELSRECLLSLTSPHHPSHPHPHPSHQHTPHQLREELRILGGLDHFANAVISACASLEAVDPQELREGEGEEEREVRERVEKELRTLGRLFKCLENVTYMNRANQSYLVVFDGSLLVSNLTRLIPLCQRLLELESLRPPVVETLLGVMKVLLNLTHDNELGSHRVGEQQGGVHAVLGSIFHLPPSLPLENQFDITVLALGLLINLVEHSAKNRTQLETLQFSYPGSDPATSSREDDDVMGFRSNYSSLRALLQLFLKHHSKAEEATIEVPTPQRLSQLGGSSPHQSPMKASQLQRELTPSFAARMKLQQAGRATSKSKKKGRGHRRDGMDWLRDSQESSSSQQSTADTEPRESESESEEEFESVPTDPLVFSREEFETALNQAGQHMEDSIVASYTALLLGIMVKHNQDTVDLVKQATPSKTFAEMIGVLKKFISFMNITGSSGTGLESIRHIVKYLEALDT